MRPIHYQEITDYCGIIVNEIPALFTNLRIDRTTLPENLFAYDIRGGCEGDFANIERYVYADHTGTILTDREIPMVESDFTPIEDYNFTGNEETEKLLKTVKS
jgi:hypothetical protein